MRIFVVSALLFVIAMLPFMLRKQMWVEYTAQHKCRKIAPDLWMCGEPHEHMVAHRE